MENKHLVGIIAVVTVVIAVLVSLLVLQQSQLLKTQIPSPMPLPSVLPKQLPQPEPQPTPVGPRRFLEERLQSIRQGIGNSYESCLRAFGMTEATADVQTTAYCRAIFPES